MLRQPAIGRGSSTTLRPTILRQLTGLCWGVFCMALVRKDVAEAEMKKMIIAAPKTGVQMQSPWLSIVNRQITIIAQLSALLCLAPAERSRLGVHDEPDASDPAEAYFRQDGRK